MMCERCGRNIDAGWDEAENGEKVCYQCKAKEDECIILTLEQIAIANNLLTHAKRTLEQCPGESSMAAGFLRDVPMMHEAGLWDSAYMLNHAKYGCCKADVEGLIEHVEKLIAGEWPVEVE